jgi:hypothetical protein
MGFHLAQRLLDRPAVAGKQGGVAITHADISRLAALTGYAPQTPPKAGSTRFAGSYRDCFAA